MTFLDIHTTDPAFNLAMEKHVFDDLPSDMGYFMLWQNGKAIIIGKHQNTQAEITSLTSVRMATALCGGSPVAGPSTTASGTSATPSSSTPWTAQK